jgi:hypothetical protein
MKVAAAGFERDGNLVTVVFLPSVCQAFWLHLQVIYYELHHLDY